MKINKEKLIKCIIYFFIVSGFIIFILGSLILLSNNEDDFLYIEGTGMRIFVGLLLMLGGVDLSYMYWLMNLKK